PRRASGREGTRDPGARDRDACRPGQTRPAGPGGRLGNRGRADRGTVPARAGARGVPGGPAWRRRQGPAHALREAPPPVSPCSAPDAGAAEQVHQLRRQRRLQADPGPGLWVWQLEPLRVEEEALEAPPRAGVAVEVEVPVLPVARNRMPDGSQVTAD